MKKMISWTVKTDDGVKRETRVNVSRRSIKWQFKRADESRWDYDSDPLDSDWNMLEDVLRRRAGRGRAVDLLASVQKLRAGGGK